MLKYILPKEAIGFLPFFPPTGGYLMKIVKNGRLFGKLNIVDVLILLVVIAAVAFLAVRMVSGSGGETPAADDPSAQANLRDTVLCEDMPLMQAENAVTAVTAEDYELKLDDDSILKVSPNQIFNSNKFQDAQITSAEILPQDDSADGQRVTVRFVIEAAAKNTVGSFYSAITRVPGYSDAKTAVANFTQWLASEMALKYGDGIRVNAIAPGFFIGDQNRRVLINPDGSLTDRSKKVLAKTPMKRFGDIKELNGAVHFLCSEAASFVTGAMLPIDGGFSAFSGV